MLKDLKVTLYDIFGYLLPGIIFLIAIAILLWTIWSIFSQKIFLLLSDYSFEFWILLLFLAYICGHMVHAIATLPLMSIIKPPYKELVFDKEFKKKLPEEFIDVSKSRVSSELGIPEDKITKEALYTFCDKTILQKGVISEHDMFEHRRGLYRGLFISLFFLSIFTSFRMLILNAKIIYSNRVITIDWAKFLVIIVFSIIGSVLSYYRYKRFARHRIVQAIMGFLVLSKINSEESDSDR